MNKRKIGITIAVLVILTSIVSLIITTLADPNAPFGGIKGYKTSSVEINTTYQDGSSELAEEFYFTYDNVKLETESFRVALDTQTQISITDFSSSSNCRIIIYRDSNEVWSGALFDGAVFYQLVSDEGTYDLVLEMSEGTGHGHVQLT